MKHNVINTGSYLLVVGEKNDGGYNYNSMLKCIEKLPWPYDRFSTEGQCCRKIISHLPLNNSQILAGVDLLPQLEQEDDVEKLADLDSKNHYKAQSDYWAIGLDSFKRGHNKAKEKYKYTEEDLMNFYKHVKTHTVEEALKHISQLKMPVDFDVETILLRERPTDMRNHIYDKTYEAPKTIITPQGQTQWVGKWIY